MKLVIDIPEEVYIFATKEDFSAIYNGNHIAKAIANGTPLTDRLEYCTDGEVYKLSVSNGNEFTDCTDAISRKAVLEASSKLCISDECCKCQFEEDTKCRLKWYKNYIKSLPVSTNTKAISTDNENNTCLKCSYFDDEFKSCAYPSMSVESMCPNELKNYNPANMDL